MSFFLELPSFIFSFVGKFSAPFSIFTAFLLFLPESALQFIQLLTFRDAHIQELWLGFIFSSSMFFVFLLRQSTLLRFKPINGMK
jgi:hypothetical protein